MSESLPVLKDNRRDDLILALVNNTLECMICCCCIRSEVAVFSCRSCFNVFHLYCAKKWSRTLSSDSHRITLWRCPACQVESDTHLPIQYRCFCGKRRDPPATPSYSTPHSCGDICGRERVSISTGQTCDHLCTELCHPGPCPQCVFLIKISCHCLKESRNQQCGIALKWSCGKICGKRCQLGVHSCSVVCHSDPCPPCEHIFTSTCHSHGIKREIKCSDLDQLAPDDSYSCGAICEKRLECEGGHSCMRLCHYGNCGPCPLLPSLVTHCPCGKSLIENKRSKCTDPIESCGKPCMKAVEGCGHPCVLKCHTGDCLCNRTTQIECRCKLRVKKDVKCSDLEKHGKDGVYSYVCNRTCDARKPCGRHRCQEKCCLISEHICLLECGRLLKCKKHNCQDLCHAGPCKRCLVATFDDWTCECGQTVVQAPIVCGQEMPMCPNPCTRKHECDHPVRHNCHSDPKCPKCTFLVDKKCKCGRNEMKNIPCFLPSVSCGDVCGRMLACQVHSCHKTCHTGPCEKDGEKCTQKCIRLRIQCGHPCGAQCHGNESDCPVSECQTEILLKCECGRLKQIARCGIKNQKTDNIEVEIDKILECDKECKRQKRLKQIADALKVDVNTSGLPPTEYPSELKMRAMELGMKYVIGIEEKIATLVHETIELKSPSRTLYFEACGWKKREFVKALAEFYGCSGLSQGWKSNRFVMIDARFGECYTPTRSITDALEADRRIPKPVAILPETEPNLTEHGIMERTQLANVTDELNDNELNQD